MYDDVLLPYDGSDGAAATLDHVGAIARRADATVHLLYVADTTRDSVTVVGNEVVDALVQEGEDVLTEAADALDEAGVRHETDVVQGNPAETIVEYADRYDHDLIAMPTRAREGVSRFLLGSVTEKVVRLSPVPVLTARMQPDERLAFPYEDLLVPTDGSDAATAAARHGLSLAASLDATVHVLSVVDDSLFGAEPESNAASEASERAAEEAVSAVASLAEERGAADVVRHVDRGSPVEEILDRVESEGVDAVVMGAIGSRGTDRIALGGVAEQTVRSAPVPVITVRETE